MENKQMNRNEFRIQNEEIKERLKKKDYILTVYQTGHKGMSSGDIKRQIDVRRYWVVCSLEEIPDYIKSMKQPFWTHEEGLSKKEIDNYSFEKKKWGIYSNVIIEPLSEELEKNYLSSSKDGFFKNWRMFRDTDL